MGQIQRRDSTPGAIANRVAAKHVFADYRDRKSPHTLRAQDSDLALFAQYLSEFDITTGSLNAEPEAWRVVTWGLVAGFVKWMIGMEYAIGSVNRALSTVKRYAELAFTTGSLSVEEHAMIKTVRGYGRTEGKRVNQKRKTAGLNTRVHDGKGRAFKKETAVLMSEAQAAALKQQPDTPQGWRDALMMCLLLDLGLRAGEAALLKVGSVDLAANTVTFHRPKVDKTQTHTLPPDLADTLRHWFEAGFAPPSPADFLLRRSRDGGQLGKPGMSERSITRRVSLLGEAVGLPGLSAHDCRHFWATLAARYETDPFALQEAGGWSSLAMPRRYIEEARVANQKVKLAAP